MSAIVRGFARQDLLQDKYKHTGRTTRLCDAFIQKLFQNVGKEIQIYDHYVTYSSDKMMTEKIINAIDIDVPCKIEHRFFDGRENLYILSVGKEKSTLVPEINLELYVDNHINMTVFDIKKRNT
nr:hypothetical protein [uncultured Prevotella sp.]